MRLAQTDRTLDVTYALLMTFAKAAYVYCTVPRTTFERSTAFLHYT